MIVLDANVVSELMRPQPSPQVSIWVDAQRVSEMSISAITAAELRAGVARLPSGRRRTNLGERVEVLIEETFAGWVLPFDSASSVHYAEIVARRSRAGLPIATADAQIAAICRQHSATLATRNSSDFAKTGVSLVDPWAPP